MRSKDLKFLERINLRILRQTRRGDRPALFLSRKDYERFLELMRPVYEKQCGDIISDEAMGYEGYANILYAGCAVCLGPK